MGGVDNTELVLTASCLQLLWCKSPPCLAVWKGTCSYSPQLQTLWIMSPKLLDVGLVTALKEQENGKCLPLKIYFLLEWSKGALEFNKNNFKLDLLSDIVLMRQKSH